MQTLKRIDFKVIIKGFFYAFLVTFIFSFMSLPILFVVLKTIHSLDGASILFYYKVIIRTTSIIVLFNYVYRRIRNYKLLNIIVMEFIHININLVLCFTFVLFQNKNYQHILSKYFVYPNIFDLTVISICYYLFKNVINVKDLHENE